MSDSFIESNCRWMSHCLAVIKPIASSKAANASPSSSLSSPSINRIFLPLREELFGWICFASSFDWEFNLIRFAIDREIVSLRIVARPLKWVKSIINIENENTLVERAGSILISNDSQSNSRSDTLKSTYFPGKLGSRANRAKPSVSGFIAFATRKNKIKTNECLMRKQSGAHRILTNNTGTSGVKKQC